jgi:predicted secreted protein
MSIRQTAAYAPDHGSVFSPRRLTRQAVRVGWTCLLGAGLTCAQAQVGAAGATGGAGGTVGAAAEGPRENSVNFSASASLDLPQDTLTVTLQATREGNDAAQVQASLKQALEAALAEARKAAQADALEVRSGSFQLSPRYGNNGRANGWVGSTDLQLSGRDIGRVAATAGRIQGMVITSTGYSLSRELREKHEQELIGQAVQAWRRRAAEIARQFGYAGYVLDEVQVHTNEGEHPRPMPMLRVAAASMDAAPLPTEPGKGTLSATVQGSVRLTR